MIQTVYTYCVGKLVYLIVLLPCGTELYTHVSVPNNVEFSLGGLNQLGMMVEKLCAFIVHKRISQIRVGC